MKKARLIYNPYSGDRTFSSKLDSVFEKFNASDYEILPYRTNSSDDIYKAIEQSKDFDCIIASGGDGTLNHVINAMEKNNIDIPIGIFPFGTANDFASHINIPKNISEACDIIINGKTSLFDIGMVNDRFFINVASAGLLTDVSQKIDINMKNTLGKVAYYLKGIEQLPNFRPIPVSIKTDEVELNEMIYLFVVLNGSTAGGFKLAPDSTANDEMLNLIAIKSSNIVDLFNLFIKMLKGEHLDSNNIIYLRNREFLIDCKENMDTDIDGEAGPSFPLKIKISNRKLKVFVK